MLIIILIRVNVILIRVNVRCIKQDCDKVILHDQYTDWQISVIVS